MNQNYLVSTRARFERKSTGTWLSLKLEDLVDKDKVAPLDMNDWFYLGGKILPGFELVTIGDDIE
jgi:membrane carboxypeptidase/penicillin-binding protein